jgi:zinc protease
MRSTRGIIGKLASVVACAWLAGAFACAEPPKAPIRVKLDIPVSRFVLSNGLEVIVQEDHHSPFVALNLRVHSGSKDDPPGRKGMAHLVEHLQFAGSAHTAPDSFYATMGAIGATGVNGTTEEDATSYYETVPTSALERMLWVEADRFASARVGWSEAAVAREKEVVGQELRLRSANEPYGFLSQFVALAVYPEGHPYVRPLDEEAEVKAATAVELGEFAARNYVPENATLVLVGDVDPATARAVVTRYFGGIARGAVPVQPRVLPPVTVSRLKRLNVVADVQFPLVAVAWALPPPGKEGFYESLYAIDVLEGYASYLATKDEKSAKEMGYRATPGRLATLGAIYAVLEPKGTAEDIVGDINARWKFLVAREDGYREKADLRTQAIARMLWNIERLGSRAGQLQSELELFGDADHTMADLRDLQNTPTERVRAAMNDYFDVDRAAVVVVTPDPGAPRSGRIVKEVPR